LITFDHVWLLALALAVDAVVGDPDFIWKRVPHPVAWVGALIAPLDRALNRPQWSATARRAAGILAIVVVVAVAAAVGYAVEFAFAALTFGWIGTAVVAAILLAGRSLYDHVAAVASALDVGVGPGRAAVARIVGRDTHALDSVGIARAAIESLAESFSDGLIAPALWFLVLGLPGLAAYKAINTADSMIGHKTEAHAEFGWAAARLDDLANLPASRLTAMLIALAASNAPARNRAFAVTRADARKLASPNAGWPEAAMAGALDLALGGPKAYGGFTVDGAWLNAAGRRNVTAGDVRRALRVYVGAAAIFAAVIAIAGLAVRFA
jgi:adenosylcobinamide-phosphate synthase